MTHASKSWLRRLVFVVLVNAGSAAVSTISAGGTGATPYLPAAIAAQPDSSVNASAAPEFPDAAVFAPRPPTDQELSGDSVYLLLHSSSHAVQGRYLTARGGGRILNTDARLLGRLELLPLWPLVIQSGLNRGGCCDGGVVSVIIVVDTTKVAGYPIGSIADYIAMLTLSVVQSPDHCDPLPSILDLMAPSCGAREKPAGITAGDLAFLKALNFHNTGLGPTLSRDDIQSNMM